ncbi:hypothetical protein LI328DRAFT_171309 [Trichoderma asperelloides]|nr:hypothetical protein LI328DRAFT_171309 [Trichoderma asperelloides]
MAGFCGLPFASLILNLPSRRCMRRQNAMQGIPKRISHGQRRHINNKGLDSPQRASSSSYYIQSSTLFMERPASYPPSETYLLFLALNQLPIREQLAACIEIVDLNTNFVLSAAANAMPRPPTTPTLSFTHFLAHHLLMPSTTCTCRLAYAYGNQLSSRSKLAQSPTSTGSMITKSQRRQTQRSATHSAAGPTEAGRPRNKRLHTCTRVDAPNPVWPRRLVFIRYCCLISKSLFACSPWSSPPAFT